jgi:LmbE family N-acetylglucosaminyl deacetylase
MAGTDDNDQPGSFHQAPLEEAAKRLADIIVQERPEVVVTYGPDGIYFHPDHVKAHHTTVAALDMLLADGWQPRKFYYVQLVREDLDQQAQRMKDAGRPNPVLEARLFGVSRAEITTSVDCKELVAVKKSAFEAHRSQIAPDSFFLNTPDDIFAQAFGTENFVLARGEPTPPSPETDLFA